MLEFLLLNHPVDCPICDQAGECKLQDYYMEYDQQALAARHRPRCARPSAVQLGPLVTLDQERCILCTRCVRFMREVAKDPQLGVAERGNHELHRRPSRASRSTPRTRATPSTSARSARSPTRDFRFRGRVWFMLGHAQRLHRLRAAAATSTSTT